MKVHVWRRIQRAQRAVDVDRTRAERHAEPLRKDDLEDIAGADIFLGAAHGVLEAFAGKPGNEIAFVERLRIERLRIARTGMTQAEGQLVEPAAGLRVGLRLRRIGMHDQVQATLEVVEHRDFLAEHEQGIGRAELVGLVVHGEARFDPADRLEAEIADQATRECRHVRQFGDAILPAQGIDLGQRIGQLARLDDFAKLLDAEGMSTQRIHAPARQADDRVATPVLAALHRLEQVGVRSIGQLQVHRQRRIEIRQHLARNRDAVVALRGVGVEFFLADHGGGTSGLNGPRR